MRSYRGKKRNLTHPSTGIKDAYSVIQDEIYFPDPSQPAYDAGDWGKYYFGAWLEEDVHRPGHFYISFPYWRNGRFAGQYTLRAEPQVLSHLVQEIERRGWLTRPGWLESGTSASLRQGPQVPPDSLESESAGSADQPQDDWERRLLGAASDCGVSLSHLAVSSEGLYE